MVENRTATDLASHAYVQHSAADEQRNAYHVTDGNLNSTTDLKAEEFLRVSLRLFLLIEKIEVQTDSDSDSLDF